MKKIILFLTVAALIQSTQAVLITTTGDPSVAAGATITLHDDVNFTIGSNINHYGLFSFRFDVSFPIDVTWCDLSVSNGLEVQLNGTTITDGQIYSLRETHTDYRQSEDLWAHPGDITLQYGDIITLKAGTLTLTDTDANMIFMENGDYDMSLHSNTGGILSSIGVVPEPATAGLFIGASLIIAAYRRIKKSYGMA